MTPKAVRFRSLSYGELVGHVQKALAFPEQNLLTIELQKGGLDGAKPDKNNASAEDVSPRRRRESESQPLNCVCPRPSDSDRSWSALHGPV